MLHHPGVAPGTEITPLSVSEYLALADSQLGALGTRAVVGEIAEVFRRRHVYFKIKDETASADCLLYDRVREQYGLDLRPGERYLLLGCPSVYRRNGSFKLIVSYMEPVGLGSILKQLQLLRARLEREGVFARPKRPLPPFPDLVGIITSPDGEVFHDIQMTMLQRNPAIKICLYPAQVQGPAAPQSLCRALRTAYADGRCDVLVIGRGGGSAEDLLAFSDEQVVRLVARSPVPIISAVGHEPDTAFTDWAADLRASTPTQAATLVTAVTTARVREALQRACDRLALAAGAIRQKTRHRLEQDARQLRELTPKTDLLWRQEHALQLTARLTAALGRRLDAARRQTWQCQLRLQQHSPEYRLRQDQLRAAQICRRLLIWARTRLSERQQRLQAGIAAAWQRRAQRLQTLTANLRPEPLRWRLETAGNSCRQHSRRLELAVLARRDRERRRWQQDQTRLTLAAAGLRQTLLRLQAEYASRVRTLEALNPLRLLRRGYSVTTDERGRPLTAHAARVGRAMRTETADGVIRSQITAVVPRT